MKRPSKKTLARGCQLYGLVGENKIYNIGKHFPNEFALSIMRAAYLFALFCVIFLAVASCTL